MQGKENGVRPRGSFIYSQCFKLMDNLALQGLDLIHKHNKMNMNEISQRVKVKTEKQTLEVQWRKKSLQARTIRNRVAEGML